MNIQQNSRIGIKVKSEFGDRAYAGFHHVARSWYADAVLSVSGAIDEVTFGAYSKDGGSHGEMTMEWVSLDGKPVPRLQAYSDSWKVLRLFADELLPLIEGRDITPDAFAETLCTLGFVDRTEEAQ